MIVRLSGKRTITYYQNGDKRTNLHFNTGASCSNAHEKYLVFKRVTKRTMILFQHSSLLQRVDGVKNSKKVR